MNANTRRLALTGVALLIALLMLLTAWVVGARPAQAAFDNKYRAHSCTFGGTLKATSWLISTYTRRYHVSATSTASAPLSYTVFDGASQGAKREYYLDRPDHGAQVIGKWGSRSCVINGA